MLLSLLNSDEKFAQEKAEKIRLSLSKIDIEGVRITASFGVAQLNKQHTNFDALVQDADTALYRAKDTGRNKTIVF